MENIARAYLMILKNRNATSFALIIMGFIAAAMYADKGQDKQFGVAILIVGVLCALMGLFGVFKDVMSSNRDVSIKTKEEAEDDSISKLVDISSKLRDIEKKVGAREIVVNVGSGDAASVKEEIEAIFALAAKSAVSDEVEKKLVDAQFLEAGRQEALRQLRRARYRLIEEIKRATKRAGTNMVIGSVISTIGIFIIGVTAFTIELHGNDVMDHLAQYAPRLLLGVFVQLFAFFFLRLYRRGFDEIRYLQNEATNVDVMGAALICSMSAGDKDAVRLIVEKMSAVERNFVIEKGQTTIELRRDEMDREAEKTHLEFAKDIISRVTNK